MWVALSVCMNVSVCKYACIYTCTCIGAWILVCECEYHVCTCNGSCKLAKNETNCIVQVIIPLCKIVASEPQFSAGVEAHATALT